MSVKSSPKSDSVVAPTIARIILNALIASGLMALAVAVGNLSDLPPKVVLDFKGVQVQGVVEPLGKGAYTLRYTGTDDAIYRSMYRDGFPYLGLKSGPMTMTVKPDHPTEFQPAGASYVPGTIAGALALCSVTMLGYVRRLIFRRHQAQTGVELRGAGSLLKKRKA